MCVVSVNLRSDIAFADESDLLNMLIVDDSSDDDEDTDQSLEQSSSDNKLTGLVVAFCLTFSIFFNIPDRAIIVLLRFFKYVFLAIGRMFHTEQFDDEVKIPLSLQKCYALLKLSKTPYIEYVSCPSCHLLFNSDILLATGNRPESLTCPFVEYPNHPQQRFRLPCNCTLFVKVQKRGKVKFNASSTCWTRCC